jgi:hypothetical protein
VHVFQRQATSACPGRRATAALSTLLERICAGGAHAECVTAVYVFGSHARGALTVGDVDVDIECDARLDPAVEREMIDGPPVHLRSRVYLLIEREWQRAASRHARVTASPRRVPGPSSRKGRPCRAFGGTTTRCAAPSPRLPASHEDAGRRGQA